jgi:hypothetical protein
MSLANSCEYLTNEKLCLAASESEKARSIRRVRCKNDEKMTCCYLCMFVLDCATPCRFLGSIENEPMPVDSEKTKVDSSFVMEEKTEEDEIKNDPVTCSLCDIEMSQTRTKFRIDGWKGAIQNIKEDEVEDLPVIIYLCPKCGKIDFRADDKQNKI